MIKLSLSLAAAAGVVGAAAFMAVHHSGLLSAHEVSAAHHEVSSAIAVITGTEGNDVTGVVKFTVVDGGVEIEAHINGLAPGKHGFHIHQLGDISAANGTSTGGHFNPLGFAHGAPDSEHRHVGDLGNLSAGPDGVARYRRADKMISLDMDDLSCIIGRAIIVHAGADDLVSQPTGAAGARVASGVIGVAK